MRHRARTASALALVVLAAGVPAAAGIHYEAVTESVVDSGGSQQTRVSAWIEGENARIEFVESGNPMTHPGTYLVTDDGGRTLYLVNPEEATYSRWSVDRMLAASGALLQSMGPMLDMEISDPQVEKLVEEDGGEILGRDVTHYRYRTTYGMKIKVLGMGKASDVETIQDIWSTSEFSDVALGVWLRDTPPPTGNEDLDRLVAAESGKAGGFPLKSETVTTTRVKKRSSTFRSRQEVTVLEEVSVDPALFALPAGYQEVELLPLPADAGEENPLGSLFGGGANDG